VRPTFYSHGITELLLTIRKTEKLGANFVWEASKILTHCFVSGGKVLVCGNGGSACDAMHFAEELTGRFRKDRKALPAISLTDPSHLTCVGNDYGFEFVFSRAVEALGKPGDVLIAISTSGNSENVVNAVNEAKNREMSVLCLLGNQGGRLAGRGDCEIVVPSPRTERIQEMHTVLLHLLIESVERRLFPENYSPVTPNGKAETK
jgi:D-sedoheptulose 7-phosphate isomerase